MVKLRLKRNGKKFNAIYKIIVADSRSPRDGRFIEEVGFYNPHSKEIKLNEELITKWLNQGAQVSDTVRTLLKTNNFYQNYTKNRSK
ncbi:30S ribosomal protein S16 [Mycoplasma miroungirhinis]|uniref:Small ribosomal subunit protein bS16 n=1 Tax=Mycoplasma miroungirhinis TaxID=754516 RepID=A0A6M4JAQ3_9MOLU|nr:30S ribosomal protein S16 [Mycoplasma miroungirhinis]QJR44043.1 30S ribosomal protein S16 [Mycoplasma miroungirhinis]